MHSRGISYSPDDLNRLGEAIQKAAAKGSKDTLVLMDSSALIVSVKNNTVVTVMDKNALKENVFTNIDSTIVM
jgi:flagellar operon protein